MTITTRQFLVVKRGNPPEYNDDALKSDVERRRFAIADGATESGFARLWSRMLVERFVQATGAADDWASWLPAAQQHWLDELQGVTIPYYGEQQFEQGSFATFLGVILEETDTGWRWEAAAVGDSCLFHSRDDTLLKCFPLDISSQFGYFPQLVGSRSPLGEIVESRSRSEHGLAESGDRLWLMSDALSRWFLAEVEAARLPWKELGRLLEGNASDANIAEWTDRQRDEQTLHNDDVALMVIEL